MFVADGIDEPRDIASMPGVVQHTRDSLRHAAADAVAAGVGGLMLFGVPRDEDKDAVIPAARKLHELGIKLVATRGTAAAIRAAGLSCEVIKKVKGGRPHTVDALLNGEIDLVVNTTGGADDRADSFTLRRTTLNQRIPYFTTISGALAAAHAIATAHAGARAPALPLQDYHRKPGFDPDSAPQQRVGYR